MKYEQPYIEQTAAILEKYATNRQILKYVDTGYKFISELKTNQNINVIDLLNEKTEMELFYEVLYFTKTDIYNFRRATRHGFIVPLSPEFMQWFLINAKQLKRPIEWNQLTTLNYKFDMLKLFNKHENLTIKQIWNYKI